jgi:hypothetical protein
MLVFFADFIRIGRWEKSKCQAPTSSETPDFKFQCEHAGDSSRRNWCRRHLTPMKIQARFFDAWILEILWGLEIGIWRFHDRLLCRKQRGANVCQLDFFRGTG